MALPPLSAFLADKFHPPKDTKPSFAGRVVLVTGANSGVGFEAAVKFVQLGAESVILGVRSQQKGDEAKAAIEARTGKTGVVSIWLVDMLDYDSIKGFGARVHKELAHLDIACLNAGMVGRVYSASKYGWEKTLQVNTLSTVLLAILLLPKLQTSRTSDYTPVLELVSSGNHYFAKLREGTRTSDSPLDVYNQPGKHNPLDSYNTSKLFLQYAQTELVKLCEGGPMVEIVTVCPGATRSSLARNNPWYLLLPLAIFWLLQKRTEEGARTYISGASLQGKGHGRFWQQDRIREPAPLLGKENEKLQQEVFADILRALRKDVADIDDLLPKQDVRA